MGNPLLDYLSRLLADHAREREEQDAAEQPVALPDLEAEQSTVGILLVLRRMRIPLIVLILMFAVSVFGLTVIPGQDADGNPSRLTVFDAFYFMSYTATTIGFGEIPHAFTPAQRMWVTFSIFLSVIGWAYAVGSLLALLQDKTFRSALDRKLFARKVARMGDRFVLVVGYGETAKRIAESLDGLGRRFVVLDRSEERVATIDLDAFHADIPALRGDARVTANLTVAGLGHPHCEGVLALSGDDLVNLDVAMTTALVRPGLPVIAQSMSREIEERMRAFGAPEVINPLDRFGDHLRILHRSPAAYQLMVWLTSAPGTPLPKRHAPLPDGHWVICGRGAFGRELTADLRAEGIEVVVVDGDPVPGSGDRFEVAALEESNLGSAAAFVAASDNDMTNLWLLQAAQRINPHVLLVARQNQYGNAVMYEAVGIDFGLVRAEVVAHEAVARLANPMLMRFLPHVPRLGEERAAELVATLVERSGDGTPHLWTVDLTPAEAPAVMPWVEAGTLRLADLVRAPQGREHPLPLVALALIREGATHPAPEEGESLQLGDCLLFAGTSAARRNLEATLFQETTAAYVLEDRVVPNSWVWRRLRG